MNKFTPNKWIMIGILAAMLVILLPVTILMFSGGDSNTPDDTQLNILYGFDAEGQARMKHLMKSFHIWKMTASEEKNETIHQVANGLDIQYHYCDDTLHAALSGRLDTLSAPELMELFDTLGGKKAFSRLVLDLEKLEYLSSTGLRVFLMMAKRLGSEHLLVDNANALVREIFETTGFTDVVVVR